MWNGKGEWVAGKLCEKGFMKEKYDEESGELVRKLTEKGKNRARELLSQHEWRNWLVEEIKKMNIPQELKRTIWLRLLKFLKEEGKKNGTLV